MASRQHFFGVPGEFGLDDHWSDAEGASTFILGLVGPNSSKSSCSSPWYVRGPSGIGNKSFGCTSWIPPPFY